MFLGPWHEMKKKPKIPFIWWFKAYTYSHWLWRVDLSKSGAHIMNPGGTTYRGTNRRRVAEGAVRTTPVRLRKRALAMFSRLYHGIARRD